MPQMPRVNRNGELIGRNLEAFHGSPQKNITQFKGPTWVAADKELAKTYSETFSGEAEVNGRVYPVKVNQGKVLKIWQFKDWVDLVNKRAPRNEKLKSLILNNQSDGSFGTPPVPSYIFSSLDSKIKQTANEYESIISKWRKENRNWNNFEKTTLENRKKFGKDYSPWSEEGYDLSSSFSEDFDPSKANFSNQKELVSELFNLGYDTISQMEMGKPTYLVKNPKRIEIKE